jgi:hypothetical protein
MATASTASPEGWVPQSLSLGSFNLGPLTLKPTLDVQVDGFAEGNNGWGGHFNPPLQESRFFLENSVEQGLNGGLELGRYGRITGRVSAIFDMTTGGLNASASNYGRIQARDYSIEDAYIKWTSGALLPGLGADAIQLVIGRSRRRSQL